MSNRKRQTPPEAAAPTTAEPKPKLRAVQQVSSVNPQIERLNENYALILIGDKTAVLKETKDNFKLMLVSAFEQWHANQFVRYNDKKIPLGKFWMKHPDRRQYEDIVFDPTGGADPSRVYNLWKGFAVKPAPGDCSKFLAHIRDNVCRGDEEHYRWVVGWFADIVQHPERKIGTSLVFRGPMGVGKTKIGEVFGRLLGPHYIPVSDPRYVTGRFNSHMISCLLLHCDEGFWAGDRAAEGKLKDLITGHTQNIEYKGKEVIHVRSYVRLLVTGNPSWLVPAGFGERRFAVFDVGEDHMQDKPYFAAIDAEMASGGFEALLHYLMQFDLSTVDIRTIPQTDALMEQKVSSLDGDPAWWLDVLTRGELPWGCDSTRMCATSKLFDMYIQHASRQGMRRKSIETQIGFFLGKHVPDLRRHRNNAYRIMTPTGLQKVYGSTYEFPSLPECRQAFDAAMRQPFDWDDREDWGHTPTEGYAGRL